MLVCSWICWLVKEFFWNHDNDAHKCKIDYYGCWHRFRHFSKTLRTIHSLISFSVFTRSFQDLNLIHPLSQIFLSIIGKDVNWVDRTAGADIAYLTCTSTPKRLAVWEKWWHSPGNWQLFCIIIPSKCSLLDSAKGFP